MKNSLWGVALIWLLAGAFAHAGEPVDEQVIASIKMEGFQNSQLMDTAFHLTEIYGPRLSGSPSLKAAAEWSRARLAEWGLENGVEVILPERALTTDNGVMIAHAGQLAHGRGQLDDPRRLDARSREAWQPPGMRKK